MIDVTVKIIDIDLKKGTFWLYVGNHGREVYISEFKELMQVDRVEQMNFDHVLRNCAIQCALAGVDIKDMTAVKNRVEGVTFKV